MAIVVKSANGEGIVGTAGGRAFRQEVEIIADTEAEITSLGETVTVGNLSVIPTPGSMAHTAGYSAIYELSPSGVWVKM